MNSIKINSLFTLFCFILFCIVFSKLTTQPLTSEEKQIKSIIKPILKEANMFRVSYVDISEKYNRVDVDVKFTAGTVYDYATENVICMNKITEQFISYLNTTDNIPKYENIHLQFQYSNRNNFIDCYISLFEDSYILFNVHANYTGSICDLYIMENAYSIGAYYYPVGNITKEDIKNFTAMKNLEQIYFSTNSYNNDMQQFADWVHEFMPECEVKCKDGIVGADGIIE